jgi:hypothetical protein
MQQEVKEVEKEENEPNKNKILITFYSAFLFLTNVLTCIYFQDYLYALLFFILFGTTISVHSYLDNWYMNIIDKLAILMVVSYGGYKIYKKCDPTTISLLTLFINICFIATIYIFLSKHYTINLHILLHLFGSIGHHLILFL